MNKAAKALMAKAHKVSMRLDAQLATKGKSDNQIAAEMSVTRDPFFLTPEWKAMRKRVIQEYGAKCMKCAYVPANLRHINIDHIRPRKLFPHLALEFDNLQVLCCACNKAKGNKHQTDYRIKERDNSMEIMTKEKADKLREEVRKAKAPHVGTFKHWPDAEKKQQHEQYVKEKVERGTIPF